MRINEEGVLTLNRADLDEMLERLDDARDTLYYITWVDEKSGLKIAFEED